MREVMLFTIIRIRGGSPFPTGPLLIGLGSEPINNDIKLSRPVWECVIM